MASTVDEVFRTIGEFRQYQWYLLTIMGFAVVVITSFPVMIPSFITAEPDWTCVDGFMNNTICQFNGTISLTNKNYKERCHMPREAWKFVDDFTSVVTEYDLVCDNSIILSIAQSCLWIGMLISLLVSGQLSDYLGRKIVLCLGCVVIIVATWVMVFPKVFAVFIVCRVFIGIGSGFVNTTLFPLLTEFTTEKYRSWMGIGSFIFWAVGISILPLIGFLAPAWRTFLLITAISATPFLFTWWLIQESPRWLLLHNKEEQAKVVFSKIAVKWNKRQLPNNLLLQKPPSTEKRANVFQLFRTWNMAKKTLISWNLWFVNALVYYGVSFGSVDLGGNVYLNSFLISVVEIPSNFCCIWSVRRFGRKKSVVIPMIVAFIASTIPVAIPSNKSSENVGSRVSAVVIAKFFINFSFSGIYLWCTELFPTVIRSTGLSTCSSMARIGSFLASYIIWLIRIHAALPFSIMGVLCLQAAALGMFLPETKGKPTLETMNDLNGIKSNGFDQSNTNGEGEIDLKENVLNKTMTAT